MGQELMLSLAHQVGTVQRANAGSPLTTKALGGASMAEPDPTTTAVTLYSSKGLPFLVDADDAFAVSRYPWNLSPDGYVRTGIGTRRTYYHTDFLHVFLMGKAPEGLVWDHINRDKLDNRRSNLRLVTRAQNCHNTGLRKTNRSGVLGVHWDVRDHRWKVQIRVYLGSFANLEDAEAAAKSATALADLRAALQEEPR